MRVVLVTNGLEYGGAERLVEALATGLTAAGDQVHVVATTRGGPVRTALEARHIPVSVLSIQSPFDARVPLKLAQVAWRFSAEVMHSHLAVADIATASAQLLLPWVRLVSTVHSGYLDLGPRARRVWRLALRRFNRVLAVSDPVLGLLPRDLGAQVLRPSLIDLGAAGATCRAGARAALGVAPETPLVMAVGRLVPVKGFDVLAQAAARLTTPGARVLVIGDGPELERLRACRALELLGSREDAGPMLAAADVVVSASRSEGFPQTLLQAMAAGLPVVATDVGGTSEVVARDETGLLVPPEDPQALAQALDRVLEDRALAARLGTAGRARVVREGFTREAMIARTRAIYRSLLDGTC